MVKRFFGLGAGVLCAVALLNLGACGDDTGTGGGVDCTDVKGYAELGSAFSKCTTCHSSELMTPTERQSAPEGFDYDTYDLAKTHTAEIIEQVEDDEMPPAGSPTLTAQEKEDMIKWAQCDTPP